jgi:HEAT repeat protein
MTRRTEPGGVVEPKRRSSGARRWLCAFAIGLGVLAIKAADAPAQSPVDAIHDLQTSDDFRVRVSAALTLGRSHAAGARAVLEQALGDAHPAVRIAAAAALGVLGDPAAVPALRQHLGSEQSAGVRSQMTTTIATLSRAAPDDGDQKWEATRYVVAIGDMHNRSQVPGTHAVDVLRSATQTHAKLIPGVLVADDQTLIDQAAARHLPVFKLDGALQRLSQARKNTELSYNAQVDYSMRRVPQQALRGVLSGSATSFGSVNALHDPGTVMALEDQAIDGAVESALRGAARGFGEASRQ